MGLAKLKMLRELDLESSFAGLPGKVGRAARADSRAVERLR